MLVLFVEKVTQNHEPEFVSTTKRQKKQIIIIVAVPGITYTCEADLKDD